MSCCVARRNAFTVNPHAAAVRRRTGVDVDGDDDDKGYVRCVRVHVRHVSDSVTEVVSLCPPIVYHISSHVIPGVRQLDGREHPETMTLPISCPTSTQWGAPYRTRSRVNSTAFAQVARARLQTMVLHVAECLRLVGKRVWTLALVFHISPDPDVMEVCGFLGHAEPEQGQEQEQKRWDCLTRAVEFSYASDDSASSSAGSDSEAEAGQQSARKTHEYEFEHESRALNIICREAILHGVAVARSFGQSRRAEGADRKCHGCQAVRAHDELRPCERCDQGLYCAACVRRGLIAAGIGCGCPLRKAGVMYAGIVVDIAVQC